MISPVAAVPALPSVVAAKAPGNASGVPSGDSFSSALTNAIDSLQQAQGTASADEAQTAAGQGNLADTMIAASQASLDTEVSTDLLDKALSSFTSIMQMTF
jgi:flagellar hook-basal body complex protein FliE